MLPLLDLDTYNAIVQDCDGARCNGRRAEEFFGDKNLALGVYHLLEDFRFCSPLLHRYDDLDKWHIEFKVSVSGFHWI